MWLRHSQNAIRPKLCGNCAFPQNFHTRKSGEITVFFAVQFLEPLSANVNSAKFSSLNVLLDSQCTFVYIIKTSCNVTFKLHWQIIRLSEKTDINSLNVNFIMVALLVNIKLLFYGLILLGPNFTNFTWSILGYFVSNLPCIYSDALLNKIVISLSSQ